MPDVPPAQVLLARLRDQVASGGVSPEVARFLASKRHHQVVPVDFAQWASTDPDEAPVRLWFRYTGPLGEDPAMHRALVAYSSDMSILRACDVRHGLSWFRGELLQASLDHAIWFHDDFRADEWLLYITSSDWAGRGRGLARGQVFAADGRLVASTTQEGMIQVIASPGAPG